jgi:hypothetical protein
MSVNYKELFSLSNNYTKEELKKSLLNKIAKIDKLDISLQEKRFMLENYYIQYKLAKNNLLYKNSIITKSNISKIALPDIFDLINKQFDSFDKISLLDNSNLNPNPNPKFFSNSYAKSYSMKSQLNPDGTRSVIESTNNIVNGKSNKQTKSYKIDSKGNKIPIKLKI